MASIADMKAPPLERRERLRAVWEPIVQDLVDSSRGGEEKGLEPDYVGLACDTHRAVFLVKETSPGGLVYRKFVVRRGAR